MNLFRFMRGAMAACVFACIFAAMPAMAQVRINEFIASTNQSDVDGEPLEWLELHNAGSEAVDLGGYALSDDPLAPFKWPLPAITLQTDAYLRIWTSGRNQYAPGAYHANFRLSLDGETVTLASGADGIIERIAYPPQRIDVSYGRDPEHPEQWLYYADPTPEAPNSSEGFAGFAPAPRFVQAPGLYSGALSVSIMNDDADAVVRFTKDGSEPDESSPVYQNPVSVNETTVLRARAFKTGYLPGSNVSASYIIRSSIDRPILSIATDSDNLWDSRTGIYANATRTGRDWERPVSMEYFAPGGTQLSAVGAGLRMHGGASRQRADKKSFRLYFRSEYGPGRLHAPVIPDAENNIESYDKLVLRAGYNDSWIHWDQIERDLATYVYDQLCRNLSGDMGHPYSRGDFLELYLNGEYWGFYNVSERIEPDLLAAFHGGVEWDVVKDEETVDGDSRAWSEFRSFITRADFRSPDDYAELQRRVDLQQMTDYFILNIWVQNTDWPNKNFYAAKPGNAIGPWRFLMWDVEWSFGAGAPRGQVAINVFQHARSSSGTLADLFDKALRNEEYQRYFIERLEHNLATVLSEPHLLMRFQELLDLVRPFMPREADRWNNNKSLSDWEWAADQGRDFIRNRTQHVRSHVYRALGEPTPTPTPEGPPRPTATPGPMLPTATPAPTPPPAATATPLPPNAELGIFAANGDIGPVAAAGSSAYLAASNLYVVEGSGADVWGSEDEFQFLYKQVTGDFSLEARVRAENEGSSDWAKAMIMARDTLDAGSVNFAARIRESIVQASSQWRPEPDSTSFSTSNDSRVDANRHDGRLRIEREGDRFRSLYFDVIAEDWFVMDEVELSMNETIFVGFAVTSHDDGAFARAFYENVTLVEESSIGAWRWFDGWSAFSR